MAESVHEGKKTHADGMLSQDEINRRYDVLMGKLTTPIEATQEVSILKILSGRGSPRGTKTYLDGLTQSGCSMTEVRDTLLRLIKSMPSEAQWEELGGGATEPQHLSLLVGSSLHAKRSGNAVAIS